MTLTIEIRDELAERLESEARRREMTPQELATLAIEQVTAGCSDESKTMIANIIAENRELYKRLA